MGLRSSEIYERAEIHIAISHQHTKTRGYGNAMHIEYKNSHIYQQIFGVQSALFPASAKL